MLAKKQDELDSCLNELSGANSELKSLKNAIASGSNESAKIVELLQSQLVDHQSQIVDMEAAIQIFKDNIKVKDVEIRRLTAEKASLVEQHRASPSDQPFANASNNENAMLHKEILHLKTSLRSKDEESVKAGSELESRAREVDDLSTQLFCLKTELQEEKGRTVILETKVNETPFHSNWFLFLKKNNARKHPFLLDC